MFKSIIWGGWEPCIIVDNVWIKKQQPNKICNDGGISIKGVI